MLMIIGLGLLVLLGIILAVYGLSSPGKTKPKTKKFQKSVKLSILPVKENESGRQPDKLIEEFEKLKSDYSQKEQELLALKTKEADFQSELARREEWVANSEEAVRKAREKSDEFEKKILRKEQELQEEFSKNVALGREKGELSIELEKLSQENKEIKEENQKMKYQVESLLKENKSQLSAIEAFKKQQENSQWVVKQDFIKLNEEYTQLEKELEAKENKVNSLTQEILELKRKQENHL